MVPAKTATNESTTLGHARELIAFLMPGFPGEPLHSDTTANTTAATIRTATAGRRNGVTRAINRRVRPRRSAGGARLSADMLSLAPVGLDITRGPCGDIRRRSCGPQS